VVGFAGNDEPDRGERIPRNVRLATGFKKDDGRKGRSPSRQRRAEKGNSYREGDEPFERTREFTIDELTAGAFAVRAEIGPADKPIVLTYKAQRLPAPGE